MNKISKKLAVFMLACMMAVGFSACDSTDKSSSDSSSSEAAVVNNDNGGDESAPAAMNQNSVAETFKDYSNKSVENGKSASWLWIDNGTEDINGDGELFDVTFKIKDGTADGNYNIVVNSLQMCNKDLKVIQGETIDGCITVGSASAPEQASAGTDNTVILENASGNAGDTITMKVKLENNPGFCTIQVGINYDSSALEITEVTNVGIIGDSGSVTKNLDVAE